MEGLVMHEQVKTLASRLPALGFMLASAESCTGGMIAAQCTDLPGSSAWFDRGFVTYSNAAKAQMLGVPMALIEQHGAVSQEVACAMALGAAYRSGAQVTVAVTGIAGPDGGGPLKPVGTVWLAWTVKGLVDSERVLLEGSRQEVRNAAMVHALQGLIQRLPV
jgi:nicotinamide-nucleotide amidase